MGHLCLLYTVLTNLVVMAVTGSSSLPTGGTIWHTHIYTLSKCTIGGGFLMGGVSKQPAQEGQALVWSFVKIGLLAPVWKHLLSETSPTVLHSTYKIDTSRSRCIDSDLANVCHIWLDYRLVSFPSLPYAILKGHKVQYSVQYLV